MRIESANDIIALRFLLSMSVKQLANAIGVHDDTISKAEKFKGKPERRLCLSLRALCEQAEHSEYLKSLYASIDTDEYASFLYGLSKSGKYLPRFSQHKCGCNKPKLNFKWVNGRDRTHLVAECQYCGRSDDVRSISAIRAHLMKVSKSIDLYEPANYSFPLWKHKRIRLPRELFDEN